MNYYLYYGDSFKTSARPVPAGLSTSLRWERRSRIDSREFPARCTRRCPVYGGTAKFQDDPHWRDPVLFYEYFHGYNGAGLGASQQTGWTGLVAKLIQLFGSLDVRKVLEAGKRAAFVEGTPKRRADRPESRCKRRSSCRQPRDSVLTFCA